MKGSQDEGYFGFQFPSEILREFSFGLNLLKDTVDTVLSSVWGSIFLYVCVHSLYPEGESMRPAGICFFLHRWTALCREPRGHSRIRPVPSAVKEQKCHQNCLCSHFNTSKCQFITTQTPCLYSAWERGCFVSWRCDEPTSRRLLSCNLNTALGSTWDTGVSIIWPAVQETSHRNVTFPRKIQPHGYADAESIHFLLCHSQSSNYNLTEINIIKIWIHKVI